MTLTFFYNFLNHHQVGVADELYRLLGDDFKFVTTLPFNPSELKGGDDLNSRPYCVHAAATAVAQNEALKLARESDVCVFGACSQPYAIERVTRGNGGLSFECGERWLKKGLLNILSPQFLKWRVNYSRYYSQAPFYKLCSSGFAAADDNKLGCYKNRHYKWGYFTRSNSVDNNHSVTDQATRIMWCARFLKLKHPELPLKMACNLKREGYKFHLDYYGDGEELPRTKSLAASLNIDDVVSFHGALPNPQVLKEMAQHDIFLFTSNRLEGWGAVANEALSNGCVLVASDCVGSTPYLIENGKNGFEFKCGDVDSLTDKVRWLINHPDYMEQMKHAAVETINKLWNPANAAQSLLQLIDDLNHGRETSIKQGPGSKA